MDIFTTHTLLIKSIGTLPFADPVNTNALMPFSIIDL